MATLQDLSYGINLTGQDPAELTKALTRLAAEILRDPARLVRAGAERTSSEAALALEISRVALGGKEEPSVSPDAGRQGPALRLSPGETLWRERAQ